MASPPETMMPVLSTGHISFYDREFTPLTTGFNIEARCENNTCEVVLSFGGVILIGFPELNICVYQDIIYDLKCPACNATLLPHQFIGVVFARCEAKIRIADESAVFRADHEETVRCEFLYDGPEVRIRILETYSESEPNVLERDLESEPNVLERDLESEPNVVSTVYLSPTNGVNLIGLCLHQECVAFKDNRGVVIVRVGLIESGIFQDLVKYRNCPSCHHKMSQDSFQSVTFLGCQGEVEYEGRTDIFVAVSIPKNIKLDISGPKVVIRVKADTQTPPGTTQTLGVRESDVPPGHMAELSEKFGKLMCSESEIPELEPGINFIAECPNNDTCGLVAIPSGHTASCKYNQSIRGKSCPECQLSLPLNSFKGVAFFLCKARVTLGGKVSVCQAGRIAEVCELSAEGVEVDLEVVERDTGHETTEQLTKGRIRNGLNVEALCINPKCSETVVTVPCPKVDECVYLDLISTLKCAFCETSIPIPFFIGFFLFRCKAEVKIGSESKTVSAKEDETKYFKIEPNGPTVTIKMMGMNISRSGKLSESSGQNYLRAGSGLNIVAECHNPECLARIENEGRVNIKAPHIRTCLLSEAVVDLRCPSCDTIITYHQVLSITFVRCRGEVKFGEQTESFCLVGDEKKDFAMPQDGPEVSINISKVRETFAKGLNLVTNCLNPTCEARNDPNMDRMVVINLGTVRSCKVHQVVTSIKCPLCGQNIPTENIIAVGFLQCTAQVKNAQGVKIYLVGSSKHLMPLDLSWEIDILPLSYRQVSAEQHLLVAGMNIQAICSHLECEAIKTQNGRVFISCGEVKQFKLGEVLKKICCPSCKSPLSMLAVKSLTFMQCRTRIKTAEKEYFIEAGEKEAIDLEIELLTPESSILILDLDQNFPEGVKKVSIDSGSEFSYMSLCRGVNFRASCPNPSCVSSQKHHLVNIMAGHLLNFDYRSAVQTLLCPSCEVHIPPEQVKGVHLLECVGKIQIDDKIQEITANKNNVQSLNIRNDGSEVKIIITQRVYNIEIVPVSRYMSVPYKRLCNGLNFCCFCKNPSCPAVKEGNGLVIVRRDNTFAKANNFSNTVCNYIEEISNLFCPACSVPLRKYYVWGIGVTRCMGKITRDGSPPKTFNPWFGKAALYALDRDDVSARVEFHHWSRKFLSFLS